MFTVPPQGQEWSEISTKFYASLKPLLGRPNGTITVVEIQRVQNLPLWLEYVKARAHVQAKNEGNANESEMWHGSRAAKPEDLYRLVSLRCVASIRFDVSAWV